MLSHLKYFRHGMLAAILVASSAASFTAKAAVQIVGATLPLVQTDYKDSLAVAQFNPDMGTLESVTITATGSGQFSQYYQNLSTSSAGSVTISQNFDMMLSLPATSTVIADLNVTPGNQTHSLQAYAGTPYFTGTSGGSQTYTASNAKTVILDSSPSLAAFTGSGMADFLVTANGSGGSNNNTGNFLVGWSTLAGLELSVIYTYNAIPEPSTWMAGIFAVAGGLVFISRSHLKRRNDLLK